MVLCAAAGCDSLVKNDILLDLKQKLEDKVYVLKNDAAQNEKVLKKGTLVKIIIKGKSDWIKVYGYSSEADPLKVDHILILYLFEDEFDKKKFDSNVFNQKLFEVITPKQDAKKDAGKK